MATHNVKLQGSSLNYFTCTLGEAAENELCSFNELATIRDFIDDQAEQIPFRYAAAFPVLSPNGQDEAHSQLLTFKDLRHRSIGAANHLLREFPFLNVSRGQEEKCIALLCPSSLEFLITWLALLRCGFSVLLIAPQCTPEAIAGLCSSCDVTALLHHSMYNELASKAAFVSTSGLKSQLLPCSVLDIGTSLSEDECLRSLSRITPSPAIGKSTAYIFHTSGTSTGIPSPIRQNHRAAFAVLPVLEGHSQATFTTTPLYHGGIADCFRAWTSGALIWLFPGADVPITTYNILSCLQAAETAVAGTRAPARYFSCVPYVLQMLSEEERGMEMLRSMEIVGVGGAALSRSLGDRLVKEGVHLISRFGSAECGFLLSSYRDFETDRAWDYLRYNLQSDLLHFEDCQDDSGLCELIVKPEWPHVAKTNREDGSFATSDLFERHPTIQNAWKYHSRRDGQITLSTGKKFDPVPLEEEVAACSPTIREAMVFGNDRPNPGVLVMLSEPTAGSQSGDALDTEAGLWRSIEAIIAKYPSHVRVFREHVIFLNGVSPLPRSSKGTLMRGVAEKTHAYAVNSVYAPKASFKDSSRQADRAFSYEETKDLVRQAVTHVLKNGQDLNDEDDFYTHGFDSMMCTRIRANLEQSLPQIGDWPLPWNVVYDCGNISRLAQFITRHGNAQDEPSVNDEMKRIARTFSASEGPGQILGPQPVSRSEGITVVLTGATGALGAYILDILRNDASIQQVLCLVRAANDHEAHLRVSESLADRGKHPLSASVRVTCLPYHIDKPRLGVSEEKYTEILSTVTHIIHAAWDVNFSLPLRSFNPHFTGLQSLLQLASSAQYPVTFSFCSSVASVTSTPTTGGVPIPETFSTTPSDANPTGYGRSKWVAEVICAAFAEKQKTLGKLNVNILRLGQLTGDTMTGAWNRSEAWPKMLSTVDIVDCLPNIEQELDWLPLDIAAKAVLETTFAESEEGGICKVYHIAQYRREKKWMDLLSWMNDVGAKEFAAVEPGVWLKKLEEYPGEHPAKALLGLWRDAYGADSKPGMDLVFAVGEVSRVSVTMRELEPLSEEHGRKLCAWLGGRK